MKLNYIKFKKIKEKNIFWWGQKNFSVFGTMSETSPMNGNGFPFAYTLFLNEKHSTFGAKFTDTLHERVLSCKSKSDGKSSNKYPSEPLLGK